jgi:hypothetical protein
MRTAQGKQWRVLLRDDLRHDKGFLLFAGVSLAVVGFALFVFWARAHIAGLTHCIRRRAGRPLGNAVPALFSFWRRRKECVNERNVSICVTV